MLASSQESNDLPPAVDDKHWFLYLFFVRYFIQDVWETSSSDPLSTFIAVKHVKQFISIDRRTICQSIPEEILLLAARTLKEACLQVTVRCPKG
ncbi:hypothetical protein CgunFtcFv8_007983 [Champsocephalus gunnari]|uniref:Uncharacterized protein n=1 Tax=Champsocephalus gunnari TaxID=52237 RepID=A0AAN8CZB5_CHAGU|nr:hypothetical protein CgunFtcFv8_007983 [Champsocephalus gunnari]